MRLLPGPSEAEPTKRSAARMLATMVLNQAARLRWLSALRQAGKFVIHGSAIGSIMLGLSFGFPCFTEAFYLPTYLTERHCRSCPA